MRDHIQEGDKLRIKNRSLDRGGYGDMDMIVATVSNLSNRHGNLEMHIYTEDNPGSIYSYKTEYHSPDIDAIICRECGGDKLYHDGKGDYLCPWCEQ